MFGKQRYARSGAGRGVSQATGAAIHSKLPKLCQHEMVSGNLKNCKQCGVLQASCGCLRAHDLLTGKLCVHGRLYLSFLSITLRHFCLES